MSYHVLVYPKFLREPRDLGEYKPGSEFGYWTVQTPQAAYRLLRRLTVEKLMR